MENLKEGGTSIDQRLRGELRVGGQKIDYTGFRSVVEKGRRKRQDLVTKWSKGKGGSGSAIENEGTKFYGKDKLTTTKGEERPHARVYIA